MRNKDNYLFYIIILVLNQNRLEYNLLFPVSLPGFDLYQEFYNLFWKIDTKDILLKEDTIINIASSANSFFIFFQGGNILELDHRTGNIISVQKLKLKNINYVYFVDKYILINQQNGKTSVFIQ